MICVSIGRTRHAMILLEHKALAEKGAELVELRLDYLGRPPELSRLLKDRPTPVVVTCRRPADQGRWRGTEEQRLALLRAAIVADVEYVDLEEDVAAKIPRWGKTKRIVSHHDFEKTPDDLEEIHARLAKLNADVVKIVTMANSSADVVRMLKLVSKATVPTVGFCMGELGQPSRILCGRYGSPFTYSTFSSERELAPGQLSFDDMRRVYRYDSINRDTQIFAVVGDPIAHSHSPKIHNAAFQQEGLNAVYIPLRIFKDRFSETIDQLAPLDIQGYSVTIPHKEAVMAKVPLHDDPVDEIGAANTMYRSGNAWRAANTDYEAVMESIRLGMTIDGEEHRLEGKKVLLLGAGGAARAAALGLLRAGCGITITSRTHARATALAEQLGCQQIAWENRGTVFADILVNCTPLGMSPNVNDTPFAANWMREGMLVFDSVYNPENTLLLKEARERGCRTVSGIEMFIRQAGAQFQFFTNRPAPLDTMRNALRKGISALRST